MIIKKLQKYIFALLKLRFLMFFLLLKTGQGLEVYFVSFLKLNYFLCCLLFILL